MAWTAPMTFLPNTVLTAAQLNTHLRDNLLELEVGKATQSGGLFTTTSPNKIDQRIPKTARVSTSQSTKKTDYVDLATPGPKVTVTTGTSAMVFIATEARSAEEDQASYMSYQITGATFREASDTNSMLIEGTNVNRDSRWCQMVVEKDLNPGVNTFTCKYKAGSDTNTSTWQSRFITVWPF